ncbi:probable UDP-N-acetylglucosamine--peptide N-acetylglucosaminyltransferase SEC isoform X2 [Magnolia sinica]|uniref:probable UDP-N-acetylglucosamine--peptide N-acetylglucosaminyltransferase SEC isoform X2 n=1 Tax=Magnolia sinica TaxID=86752 RepID=UPI00265AD643|nr:probable UDP-N-acetylglucosamine--peptide N-acetylglucosaminyltransferase SEC isoform X2 [Magnolia sinica]
MSVLQNTPIKPEPIVENSTGESLSKHSSKIVIADLNVHPPESDGEDCKLVAPPHSTRGTYEETSLWKSALVVSNTNALGGEDESSIQLGKCHSKLKGDCPLESGPDVDADQQCQGVSTSREDKVSSLKYGLVRVARKMPKNAHAHFILGLMYQRLGQPQKAVGAFEKSSEILLQCDDGISRPELLSLVQIHHAQCLLQGNTGDTSDKELELEELDDILLKLRESVQSDVRQAAVWNTLGLILLRTGRLQSAISVLSSLLALAPDYLDALANLGVAYLQSGKLELCGRCFQDLILKDQNHPAALTNYAGFLLCKYGSVIAGAGANSGEGASASQVVAANVAKECLAAAAKADPKAGRIWVNLANAYDLAGDPRSAGKCLEQAARLEPNRLSTRYAIALHRIKEAERSQEPTEQLCWAANEMASILREGDPTMIELRVAWAGLAMVHRAQHEIASAFADGHKDLREVKERALYTLKQAMEEDSDDVGPWNQLGLYKLCTLQFKTSQKYLKAAVARCKECSYTWSNLEGRWEDAKSCFGKALEVDPLLDAAKSNMMKAVAMSRICTAMETSLVEEK